MQDIIAMGIGISTGMSFAMGTWIWMRSTAVRPAPARRQLDAAILLRDGQVIDTSPDADRLLGDLVYAGLDWPDLCRALHPRFPNLPDTPPDRPLRLAAFQSDGIALSLLPSAEGLHLRFEAPLASLPPDLTGPDAATGPWPRDASPLPAPADDRLDLAGTQTLADVLATMPYPAWRTDDQQRVVWANPAYHDLCQAADLPVDGDSLFAEQIPQDRSRATLRARLTLAEGQERWFEVAHRPGDSGMVHYATPIDQLVQAEIAQRNFVQTLTKTFAHLPIGLAVFDRDRRLVLFNPAMVDLTRLPIDFLSARPNLLSFFDHVRDTGMMPEPKSYQAWRRDLPAVIDAARDDRYCEVWNLPSGLTYRITGRPHPDGAVAFLLEDISSEVTLTRRFRSEIALTQSVFDRFDEAVAVFSQLGVMTFCNAAFRSQWDCDLDDRTSEVGILEISQLLQVACEPSDVWGRLQDFVLTLRDRRPWEARLTRRDGLRLRCMIEPVSGGSTLIRFVPARKRPRKASTAVIEA